MTGPGRRAALLLLVIILFPACGLVACRGTAGGKPVVTVLGSWTGDEESGFLAMLRGFERRYGIQVAYTGTRDADAVLASDLKDGDPPDLAVLATPGEMQHDAAAGLLTPIDRSLHLKTMARQYAPGWLRLMQAASPSGTMHYYAVIVKAALKSVIWYDPARFPARYLSTLTSPKLTWSQLTRVTDSLAAAGTPPWCIGMEDSSNSGWPGTDWIEDILLHQSGPQIYDRWVDGTLPWTSAPIMRAWRTFGQVANKPGLASGGTAAELVTGYGQAGQAMFTSPPECYLDHEASFITAFYTQDRIGSPKTGTRHPHPGADFSFMPFPPSGSAGQDSEEVAGDLLGMFNNTPAARRLIAYLTTASAQDAWISRPGSGAISVNRLVPLRDYPDPVSRELARNLTHAINVRFDASDSMPSEMESAFNNAVLEYLDSPRQLEVILHGLDHVRKAVYSGFHPESLLQNPDPAQPRG